MKRLTVLLFLMIGFSAMLGAMITPVLQYNFPEVEVNPVAVCAVVFIGSLLMYFGNANQKNVALAGISVEIWVKYIMDNLFKDNSFLELCHKDDEHVVNGSIVHIPQAGAKPTVVKNRNTFPAAVVQRTDSDIVYPLDVYTSDPTHIPKAELLELSYSKIDSVLSEHMNTLRDVIGDAMLFKWAPTLAANIIPTTGTADIAHLPSATGNRKILVKENLKKAQLIMNKHSVSKSDRYAVLDSDMLGQLQDDADLKKRDNGMELDLKNGVIMRLYGFNILERSSVLTYTNDGTPVPKDYDALGAAADNAGALCYQKDAVARALGVVDFFENIKDAVYFGDVYSALVKFGGRKRRANQEGIVSIVQAHA